MTPLPDTLLEAVASAAVREGLADAIFTRLSTPIGRLLVVQGPNGLVRVGFEEEPEDALLAERRRRARPARDRLRPRARRDRATRCRPTSRATTTRSSCPSTCGSSHAPFRREVLEKLHDRCAAARPSPTASSPSAPAARRRPAPPRPPAPATRSRSSCRATACCPGTGGIGNYGGGAERKRVLLELEGLRLAPRDRDRLDHDLRRRAGPCRRRPAMPPILSTTSWPSVTLPSSA